MHTILFDIEANGLDDATIIWTFSYRKIGRTPPQNGKIETVTYPTAAEIRKIFEGVDLVIGHNIIDYDLRTIQRILGVEYHGGVFDTYVVSSFLWPDRPGGHGLEAWGERLGYPKKPDLDWSTYSPEMIERCEGDVQLNEMVYRELVRSLSGGAQDATDNHPTEDARCSFRL